MDSAKRLELACREILEASPDICLLQEVQAELLPMMKEKLEVFDMEMYYCEKESHNFHHGNVIAYKKASFREVQRNYVCFHLQEKNFPIDHILTSELYHGTNAQFMVLEHLKTKRVLLFVNTHLPYNIHRGHLKLFCLLTIFRVIE